MAVLEVKFFAFLCLCSAFPYISGEIINQNVERTIDLITQLVKETTKIVAKDSAGKPIREYVFSVPEHAVNSLAYIRAVDSAENELLIQERASSNRTDYVLTFKKDALVQNLVVETIFSKYVSLHPDKIRQNEKQLVRYVGTVYFFTPYQTILQNTHVKLSSSNIISYTQLKPYTVRGSSIRYGPFEDIAPFSTEALTVHYENENPFMIVNRLERDIEISHWGNIAIKESISLYHSGAKLKGPFSRYEFQKDGRSGQAAVKSYKTILPSSAHGIYYRDSNGNISTSNMMILRDSVELEIRPRFPLFGGWRTHYILGYNVPSFEYLFNRDNDYMLKIRVIDHIYDDMIIDEAIIRVILPEGSSNIELIPPYPVNRSADSIFYSYLDTFGRPAITFSKTNLVENHIADFKLKYTYSKMLLLQEPFLLVNFIFLTFVFTIIFKRLDFSIAAHSSKE